MTAIMPDFVWNGAKKAAPLPRQFEFPEHLQPFGTPGPKLLQIERSKASFSSQDLAEFVRGKETLERQARLLQVIENEPAFDKSRWPYMSRTERYTAGIRKEKRMAQLQRELEWDNIDMHMAEELLDVPAGFGLHKSMFLETLRSQTTDEQKKLFLEPALKYDIVGCYAQTELGHGSNVAGLETTATYDLSTQEFVLHSPTMTSAKWWAGSLGRTADHAIVMAQLITKGKRCGPHPFLVPIRDPTTRKPLPGRTMGDIGPKSGYNSMDNGTMLLDHVRVPHINMMARFSSVDPNTGDYKKPEFAQLAYGTMTFIRANIVLASFGVLARAATVAVRYTAIRRQFTDKDAPQMDDRKPAESQVLNYQMVQYRLFPIIAAAFAFHFTGKDLYKTYLACQGKVKEGDYSMLNEIHATSSGLKCYTTIYAADAIESCRRACGGHGFSAASGTGSQYQDYLPTVTYEGDSYLLTQQTGRYLFKVFRALWYNIDDESFGRENVTAAYIRRYIQNVDATCSVRHSGDFRDPQMFINAFGHRAAYLIGTTVRRRDIEKRGWNSLLVQIDKCSHAHSQYIIIRNFANTVMYDKELATNPALHYIIQMCFELYACYTMDRYAAEFLSSRYLSPEQHELLRGQVDELLAAMRPQAVPIVDGFACPDYLLNSALGRQDGDVYRALVDFANREPLNGIDVNVKLDDEEIVLGQGRSKL